MKIVLNLAWLAIALADIVLGYLFIWQWAQTPDLAVFVMAVGLINAYWAISGLRGPKVKFNYLKGVSNVRTTFSGRLVKRLPFAISK